MEHADGDKGKIVFTSPEAMIEFSGEKFKTQPQRSSKNPFNIQLFRERLSNKTVRNNAERYYG